MRSWSRGATRDSRNALKIPYRRQETGSRNDAKDLRGSWAHPRDRVGVGVGYRDDNRAMGQETGGAVRGAGRDEDHLKAGGGIKPAAEKKSFAIGPRTW